MTKSVLAVEDEPNIIQSLEFLVKKAGYGVGAARDGGEALQAIEEVVPDAILLDVIIPKNAESASWVA